MPVPLTVDSEVSETWQLAFSALRLYCVQKGKMEIGRDNVWCSDGNGDHRCYDRRRDGKCPLKWSLESVASAAPVVEKATAGMPSVTTVMASLRPE